MIRPCDAMDKQERTANVDSTVGVDMAWSNFMVNTDSNEPNNGLQSKDCGTDFITE